MLTKDDFVNDPMGTVYHGDHVPGGRIMRWRKNGATKTWKTRPDEFKVPVKYGLRDYGYINQDNAVYYHRESECPDNDS